MAQAQAQSSTPIRSDPQRSSVTPAVEQIVGRVESVTETGIRVNQLWYEWPSAWSGHRPSVGQVVRLGYKTRRIIHVVVPLAAKSARAAPVPRAAAPEPKSGAQSRPRQTVKGVIAARNARGVRIGEMWYNFSRFTPLSEAIQSRLVRGAQAALEIENGQWIVAAVIGNGAGDKAASADKQDKQMAHGQVEEQWDDTYL